MKFKISILLFFSIILLINFMLFSQYNSTSMWNQNSPVSKCFVGGKYSPLPAVQNYSQRDMTTHIYHTQQGDVTVPPNVKPYPNAADWQSEEWIQSQNDNSSVMYGGFNSGTSSTFYGTGWFFTSNGGTSWTGNTVSGSGTNEGDPAPFIYPTGSTYAGRLGMSFIGASGIGATYSTDNGNTWSTYVNFSAGGGVDKNLSCVDNVSGSPFFGRAYTVWWEYSGSYVNRIVGTYTTNGGVSWATPGVISPVPAGTNFDMGADACVGPGGVLYVVWAYSLSNGQNSTEIGLGFAKSTDGGVTFPVANNQVVVTNGVRNSCFLSTCIRINGFPQIKVDKTGGSRNGWIYVTMGEKTTAPALDNADITMMRSTDGGTTWNHTRVNQDAAGAYQWFPSLAIDPYGNIGVSYYDERGLTSPLTQYYMSFSNNGGNNWTDYLVSDHTFTPTPWTGIYAAGYQGDYTGICYGNGKFWPCWCDNSSGSYQVWTVPISMGPTIVFTPLPNSENLNGPYVVNCTISPAGAPIVTSKTKIMWSRNNTSITDSVQLTNSSGNNWTGNIPGNGSPATYRYYIKTADTTGQTSTAPPGAPGNLYSFMTFTDVTPPVIYHTPLTDVLKNQWPVTVLCSATDNLGVDSVWVIWFRNSISNGLKRFNLTNVHDSTWSNPFNSDTSQVSYNDSIFYRIVARDISVAHNQDTTPQYHFKLLSIANTCAGAGTTACYWPFNTYFWGARTEILYTASELISGGGAPGWITQIGFNVSSYSSQTMNGFNINMQNTSASTITGFTTSGWTNAYSGTYTVPGTGEQFILMQTPFHWNGTSNLLIEICFTNSSYTTYSNVNGTAATNMCVHGYANSNGCNLTSATVEATRPNICMTMNMLTGVEKTFNPLPVNFSLSQNYPNPFNPVTDIKYSVPKTANVKLIVYDVIGREVQTLVSENKQAGNYEVKFDGTNFASGVYFYRIEAGNFAQVKKMVLIK